MRSIRFRMLAVAAVAAASGAAARAAEPEGEKVFQQVCAGCHGTGQHPLDAIRLSRARWKEEVERMEGLGAEIPGGKKLEVLLDWLAETHGPAGGGAPDGKTVK